MRSNTLQRQTEGNIQHCDISINQKEKTDLKNKNSYEIIVFMRAIKEKTSTNVPKLMFQLSMVVLLEHVFSCLLSSLKESENIYLT